MVSRRIESDSGSVADERKKLTEKEKMFKLTICKPHHIASSNIGVEKWRNIKSQRLTITKDYNNRHVVMSFTLIWKINKNSDDFLIEIGLTVICKSTGRLKVKNHQRKLKFETWTKYAATMAGKRTTFFKRRAKVWERLVDEGECSGCDAHLNLHPTRSG